MQRPMGVFRVLALPFSPMHYLLHPVTFEIEPQLRMSGGPRFSNTFLEDGAGQSQSVVNWDEAIWEWTLQFKKGSRGFGHAMGFWMARAGGGYGWYFEDPYDHTHSDNEGTGAVRQRDDGKFYLGKIYPDVDSFKPYFRRIRCPKPGTVQISGTGGTPVVNYQTGEVTGITQGGNATFEFVNPVAFMGDFFDVERAPGNAPGDWSGVTLREIRKFTLAVGGA